MAAGIAESPSLTVSVNASVVQLSDPMIAFELDSALRRWKIRADSLLLEITETAMMERLETARSTLEDIAALGVRIVIDDFGTGYSSISRLGDLPIVGVKIDKAFTVKLGTEPSVNKVIGAITDLAHALDLRVVAEGVETEQALSTLSDLGCDFAQGFHVGRPVPREELAALIPRL